MNVKAFAQLLAITFLASCHVLALSLPLGGCYDCEEEVWEEVPCSEIPGNNTMYPSNTTTTTTTTSTSSTSTTTTTPRPTDTTTEDPYKKCYCECKVGCKEFCRKVNVNPEPKKQILQVSKITEPIPQGHLESTHYHQRELIPKRLHHTRYNQIYHEPGSEGTSYVVHPAAASGYAKAETLPNRHTPTKYNSAYITKHYDHPYRFENSYYKPHKTVQTHFGNNIELSVGTTSGHPRASYPSSRPVKNSDVSYDSVETYVKDFIHDSPTANYNSYNGFGGHHYSMPFR